MKLRVINEPWKTELAYVVQEWREPLQDWIWVSSHNSELDADACAVLRLRGPIIVKEYEDKTFDTQNTGW